MPRLIYYTRTAERSTSASVLSLPVAAVDRPGEPQLLVAAVREPQGDTPPLAVPRRAAAAGAGRGRQGPPRQPAAAGCVAPLQLQEEGTFAHYLASPARGLATDAAVKCPAPRVSTVGRGSRVSKKLQRV